ncbi:sigma-70 family RNA polymerase sigma factor [Streptomyces sp. NPDC088817]|uniref:sigma-70 family RNA polymerase sigma factor n=1 Tax=Streptomyces sp. NPDC088817 TaxID=3365907 RepID=UPI0037F2F3F6
MWVEDWSSLAACRTADPDELFVQGSAQLRAKAVCQGCQVRTECLADALDNRVEFGVWGGMTEGERRALLDRRPTVTSWRRLLETATKEYSISTGRFEEDFAAIFRESLHRLVGFLITAGARRVDAEDAVQMAFIELARNWHSVEKPIAWVRRVSFRLWTKILGKNRLHELSESIPDSTHSDSSDELVEKSQVVQFLRRLPPLQQAVMAFAYDGCSPAETAEAMGMSPTNVRQNLHRARANLAKILHTEGIG